MGMVAKPQVDSAEKDVTDVDDGAEKVTAGAFWPEILLRDLRLASRIPGRTTTSRLKFVTTEAVAHVTDQLDDWRGIQESAGYSTLADVPARMLNGESVKVYRYRRAVYSAARALILENARDVDTTEKGDRKADALEVQTDDLWRDVRWAIADIRGTQRLFVELV
ncbi:capsid assembly protein [Salmonella enterica subsp. enterica serovar Worthington]|uniref:Head completion/stabilization protein n=1 Tax=Salmonella enterica subsp. enterica serovar Ank TaxID=1173578 RepID=A0A726YBH8_SALET|nr:head completion/stabilization protein [Salmonella enterica subsp. enterica serovar Denver]ECD5428878.1 head completion/stabilization protein [Salmonella enterica subsp. enterica serovar Denver]EGI5054385.1 capsid assembly protein [Salmonella enterica subsp. enterica serovar Worthington]HAE1794528.1 head completion/stabilization protein [Salmonella enterica subsp. enterica serovar Ank]HCM3792584.1 head completion/stabilization protein [Salmonella enterica subsp. enterica serovar Denver]